MVKEINDEAAMLYAKELKNSFALNGNNRTGQAEYLTHTCYQEINIIDYCVEDLLANSIILSTLVAATKRFKRHAQSFDISDEQQIKDLLYVELDRVFQIAHEMVCDE